MLGNEAYILYALFQKCMTIFCASMALEVLVSCIHKNIP